MGHPRWYSKYPCSSEEGGDAYVVWIAEEHDPGNLRVQTGGELSGSLVRNLCALAVAAPDNPCAGTLQGRLLCQGHHAVRTLIRASGKITSLLDVRWYVTQGRGFLPRWRGTEVLPGLLHGRARRRTRRLRMPGPLQYQGFRFLWVKSIGIDIDEVGRNECVTDHKCRGRR